MRKHFSNQKLLQDYGILFENLKTQVTLKTELADYGYDDAEVAKGKVLYDQAQSMYQQNIKEEQEETTSYAVFAEKFERVLKVYRKDRKKAKIIYKDKVEVLKNLKIKGGVPRRMVEILGNMAVFYQTLSQDEALRTPLKRLKITDEHIQAQATLLSETEKAYANYTQEKGESQDATKQKDKAFDELEKWVRFTSSPRLPSKTTHNY